MGTRRWLASGSAIAEGSGRTVPTATVTMGAYRTALFHGMRGVGGLKAGHGSIVGVNFLVYGRTTIAGGSRHGMSIVRALTSI